MYCKKCDKSLPDDSLFCPYCGGEATEDKKQFMCTKCKRVIPEDSEFCPFCGEKISYNQFTDSHKSIKDPDLSNTSEKEKNNKFDETKSTFLIGSKGIVEKTSKKDTVKAIIRNIHNRNFGKREVISLVSAIVLMVAVVTSIVAVAVLSKNKESVKIKDTSNSYSKSFSYSNTTKDNQAWEHTITSQSSQKSYDEIVAEMRKNRDERSTASYSTSSEVDYWETKEKTSASTTTTTKAVKFETLTYSGSGKGSVKRINMPQGDYYIICSYSGEHNFFATFYKSTSESYGPMIANFIGSGKSVYGFHGEATNGYIDVDASGSWTITIEKCSPSSKQLPLKYSGSGTTGIKNINLPYGEYYITCRYSGEHNFTANFYSSTDVSYGPMIANFIGSGEETYAFSGSANNGYIKIVCSGDWTVEIEAV